MTKHPIKIMILSIIMFICSVFGISYFIHVFGMDHWASFGVMFIGGLSCFGDVVLFNIALSNVGVTL